jgi:hypothetical protein
MKDPAMRFDTDTNTLHVSGQNVRIMQTICPSQIEENRNLAADELLSCLADLCAAWGVSLAVDGTSCPMPEGSKQQDPHCLTVFAAFQEVLPPKDAEAMEAVLLRRDLDLDGLVMEESKVFIPAGRVAHLTAVLASDPVSLGALKEIDADFWLYEVTVQARCLLAMRRMQAFGGVVTIKNEVCQLEPGEMSVLELAISRMRDDLSLLLPQVPELEDEPGDHDHLFGS